MGEIFKPHTRLGRDLTPLRHPLPQLLQEQLRRRLEKARGVKLVCNVCGQTFADPIEAWLHQEKTGHRCFKLELEIV